MLINWNIICGIDEAVMSLMQLAADQSLICEGIKVPCSVSVCLCDDERIRNINQKYRGTDSSTDVLSFPSVNYPSGRTARESEELLRRELDDESGTCFLGDIVISVPHIHLQAAEYGHSVRREAAYLLVHGICHLMGYDHIKNADKEKMRIMEEKILSAVDAGRNEGSAYDGDEEILRLAREAMSRSYSPYSGFPVGAAIHSRDGRFFQGCNIENASFGLTNCAERTSLFKAVSEGAKEFDVIAIAARKPAWPCGACRQVLNEFAPDIRVLITWQDHVEEKNLRELLPEGFGPQNL